MRIWRNNRRVRRLLAAAVCVCIMGISQNVSAAETEEETVFRFQWGELETMEHVLLLFDQSGSVSEDSDVTKDVKQIFLELLYENPHIDCTLIGFDQILRELTAREALKITKKETDILGMIEGADYRLKHGKTDTSLVIVSDFMDTYADGRKMDPDADSKLISDRGGKVKAMIGQWSSLKELKRYCFYIWDAPGEAEKGYQCAVSGDWGNKVRSISRDGKASRAKARMNAVEDAVSIMADRDDLEWIEYGMIDASDEDSYREYYLFTEKPVQIPKFLEDGQEMKEIGEGSEEGGYIYYVRDIAFLKLGLRTRLDEVEVLRVPEVVMEFEYGQVLGNKRTAKEHMLAYALVTVLQDGIPVEETGRTIIMEYNGNSNEGAQKLVLDYNKAEGGYYGTFDAGPVGDYDINVYLKTGEKTETIGHSTLVVGKADVFLDNYDRLKNVIQSIPKDGSSIDLDFSNHFGNWADLELWFETGDGLEWKWKNGTLPGSASGTAQTAERPIAELKRTGILRKGTESYFRIHAKYKDETEYPGEEYHYQMDLYLEP